VHIYLDVDAVDVRGIGAAAAHRAAAAPAPRQSDRRHPKA